MNGGVDLKENVWFIPNPGLNIEAGDKQ